MVYIVMAPSRRLDLSHNNIGAVGMPRKVAKNRVPTFVPAWSFGVGR